MKTLKTPYDGKLYKFCFKNIETNEWTLANKKPKEFNIQKDYWRSILNTHYQYHITTLLYDSKEKCVRKSTGRYYTELQFVRGMMHYLRCENRRLKGYLEDSESRIDHWTDQIKDNNRQIRMFDKRKKEILASPQYLWQTLKA
jgi:hypothetical protein